MKVIDQAPPSPAPIPGIDHATWAGHDDGTSQLSVWRQSLAPAAATPPHRHDCDEVVLCHAGQGEVHSEGEVLRFGPDNTVVLPGGKLHQIFNVGETPLQITGIFAESPVRTYQADDAPMTLPWRT